MFLSRFILAWLLLTGIAQAQTPNQNILRMNGGIKPVYQCYYTNGAFCGGETFSRTSNAMMTDTTGAVTTGPNQLFLNSASGLTGGSSQNITIAAGAKNYVLYCISATGTGVITASGAGYGSGAAVTCSASGTSGVIVSSTAGGTLTLTQSVATVSNVKFSQVTYETSLRLGDNIETDGTAFYGARFDHTYGVNQGLWVEESRTDVVLFNRDLTNGAWTAGATMTVAHNQTGVGTTANSASLLTGARYPRPIRFYKPSRFLHPHALNPLM